LTPDRTAIVRVSGVSRRYGARPAVSNASLTLNTGRILGLLGASGSGKSTLLRLICGLEPVDAGEIEIDGVLVSAAGHTQPPEARRVGMVFQDFALFPHLTVAQNVAFGLKGDPAPVRDARVRELLERVRLSDSAAAWPHALSGGEQQRVALARAMARDPAVILLDEPFSSLDGPLRAEVRDDLIATLRGSGACAIIVTHDAEDAMVMADDLVLMEGGRVIQSGAPEDCYRRPASVAAARLLGPVNLIAATVKQGVATCVLGQASTELPDGPVWVGVRPTDLWLNTGSPGISAVVTACAFAGAYRVVTVKAGEVSLVLHRTGPAPAPGERVQVSPAPDSLIALPR
jgi:iron(III) transport system ATP-binding protein